MVLVMGLCACERRPVASAVTGAVKTDPAFSDLSLSLTDAAGVPQGAHRVSWRPVFAEPDAAESRSALTDEMGNLQVSQLLPGVRYLFSTVFAGQTLQRWYRVPASASTPAAEGWQWIVDETLVTQTQASDPPPAKPERLLYVPGSSSTFSSALAAAAEQMQVLPLNLRDLRAQSDVVWWVSGDFDVDPALLTPAAREDLEAFVLQGGRLIMNGEWAGMYSDLRAQTQALGQRLGVVVSQDTLAQADLMLNVDNIHPHWLTVGVENLVLSRSGSVRVYNPGVTEELAFAPAEHYRIAYLSEQHTVLAVLRYGQGTIIAVGDSSLWSDSLFDEKDNAQLWKNSLTFFDPASVSSVKQASVKLP